MKRQQALPPVSEQIGPGGLCGWCKRPYLWLAGAWWCSTESCRVRQARGAVAVGNSKTKEQRWLYVPTSKGMDYEESPAKNRMLGGAAGGAKSHILRWGMLRKAMRIPGYVGLIVRRTYGELEKSQLRRLEADVPLLGGTYTPSNYIATFPQTGAIIEAGHLDDKSALSKWLSTEYDEVVADEGSTFDPELLLELSTRARSSKPAVKAAGGARFGVGTNPGGPAWSRLLDLFVTHEPDWEDYSPAFRKKYRPEQWCYVKALLDDNPYRDEDYEESLAVLGPERYEQLRWGAEFVTDGQFFSEFRAERDGQPYHVASVDVPPGVDWTCGMDWGHNSPGWIGFFAHLADGHYHLKREYKFKGQIAEQVAKRFHEIRQELGITVRYVSGDPAMWAKTGAGKGESIAETLRRCGLPMRKGDNDRFNGAMRMHEMFRDDGQGTPYLTSDPGNKYFNRSIPALVQDPHDPDDVDTTKDDHAYDGSKYWAMSRPRPTVFAQPKQEPVVNSPAWHRQQYERSQQGTGVLA